MADNCPSAVARDVVPVTYTNYRIIRLRGDDPKPYRLQRLRKKTWFHEERWVTVQDIHAVYDGTAWFDVEFASVEAAQQFAKDIHYPPVRECDKPPEVVDVFSYANPRK